ncbi:hypothetical protein NC653_032568 [Populus alba x Populus x berolinensis]|uniref:Uncharacterized protein n=1 Tax=Populus alba x Populus x berolinensis TaxID=444605 RepID=A0AAD6PZY7_9ROSI|nr:hypothetical protein NC653_032568 [Populus alba x Populus x berolinensis]
MYRNDRSCRFSSHISIFSHALGIYMSETHKNSKKTKDNENNSMQKHLSVQHHYP